MSTGSATGLLLAWRGETRWRWRASHPSSMTSCSASPGAAFAVNGRLHRLAATALVTEAYLRLVDAPQVNWQDRTHFLAVAARVMRRVRVDIARAGHRHKRGDGVVRRELQRGAGDA